MELMKPRRNPGWVIRKDGITLAVVLGEEKPTPPPGGEVIRLRFHTEVEAGDQSPSEGTLESPL